MVCFGEISIRGFDYPGNMPNMNREMELWERDIFRRPAVHDFRRAIHVNYYLTGAQRPFARIERSQAGVVTMQDFPDGLTESAFEQPDRTGDELGRLFGL